MTTVLTKTSAPPILASDPTNTMPAPTTCQHPGCHRAVRFLDWKGDGTMLPASRYCDECFDAFYNESREDVATPISRLKKQWGAYSAADILLLPPRILRHYEPHSAHGTAVETGDAIALCADMRKGMLIQGDTGLGKTYTLALVAEHHLRVNGRMPKLVYAPTLRTQLAEAATGDDSSAKGRLVQSLIIADHLIIDDIGMAGTDAFDEAMAEIIEGRYKNQAPVSTSLQQTSSEYIQAAAKYNGTKRREAILRRVMALSLIFKVTKATP